MLRVNNLIGFGRSGSIPVNAVDFDAATYLTRGADLDGVSDSPLCLFSCWFRLDAGDGTLLYFFSNDTNEGFCTVFRDTDNKFKANFYDATGALSYKLESSGTVVTGSAWRHIAVSVDTNFAAGNKLGKMYIDGADVTVVAADAAIAFNIAFSSATTNFGAMASTAGNGKWNGCIAEYYLAPMQYLALATNIGKFYSAGRPVSLGGNGSVPTGTPPAVYFNTEAASYGSNAGTGGNYSVTAGSVAGCSSAP